jgi:hypothetical protein
MPSIDIEQRLTTLERENAQLRGKLARMEAIQQRGKSAIVDHAAMPVAREVSISHPIPASTFPMPTTDELCQLMTAVGRVYPELVSSNDIEYRKQFEACFLAIGNLRRLEKPSSKVYLSWHLQLAETILRRLGRPMTVRGDAFVAACLAHADVPISGIGRHHEGYVVEIGLDEFNGRLATDAWRKILAGEAPREAGVQRRQAPPSPARVVQHF